MDKIFSARVDEMIVKMFQVVPHGDDRPTSGERRSVVNNAILSMGLQSHYRGRVVEEERSSRPSQRSAGVPAKSLMAAMEHVTEWQTRCRSRQPVCVMSK